MIFFSSGSYTFSGIIQRLTKSTWSHVAVIYVDERLAVSCFWKLSLYRHQTIPCLNIYTIIMVPGGHIKAKSYRQTNHRNWQYLGQRNQLGLDELTRPYDNYEIVRIMISHFIPHQNQRKKKKPGLYPQWNCAMGLPKAGVVFKYR